jgi:hypothetical protein
MFFEDIMENYNFSPLYCKNYNTSIIQVLEIKEHLIIEPVVPLIQQKKSNKHLELSFQLKDISTILKVQK